MFSKTYDDEESPSIRVGDFDPRQRHSTPNDFFWHVLKIRRGECILISVPLKQLFRISFQPQCRRACAPCDHADHPGASNVSPALVLSPAYNKPHSCSFLTIRIVVWATSEESRCNSHIYMSLYRFHQLPDKFNSHHSIMFAIYSHTNSLMDSYARGQFYCQARRCNGLRGCRFCHYRRDSFRARVILPLHGIHRHTSAQQGLCVLDPSLLDGRLAFRMILSLTAPGPILRW